MPVESGGKLSLAMDTNMIIGVPLAGVTVGLLLWWALGFWAGVTVAALAVLLTVIHVLSVRFGRVYREVVSVPPSPAGSVPRNHVICLDGTWNYEAVQTNLFKLYKLLEDSDPERQVVRYYPGVGVRENVGLGREFLKKQFSTQKLAAFTAYGKTGARQILDRAYFDFRKEYRTGDHIFIFGFSRGAATARGLANYICKAPGLAGKVEIQCMKSDIQKDPVIEMTCSGEGKWGTPEIEFLGLWDSVGSMGNPVNKREFFDCTIPAGVKRVSHLVAIDERRVAFDVMLIDEDDRVEEIWFPGWHPNVGGGHTDCRLSDISLRFMLKRAKEAGVMFKQNVVEIECHFRGDLSAALWPPAHYPLKEPREVRVQNGKAGSKPRIHESLFRMRHADGGYNPKNIPDVHTVVGWD